VLLVASTTGVATAAAHDAPGVDEDAVGNYRYEILTDEPAPGITVRFVVASNELELSNTSGRTVVVTGYAQEPYLRVGPDGVFTNANSPATYLNESAEGSTEAPPGADAEADPEWQRVGDGPTVRWHDHRAHWMAPTPRVALDEPSRSHLLAEWSIPLTVDGVATEVRGTTSWVPSPALLPWVLLGIALVAVVLAAAWWRSRLAVAVAAVVLLAAAAIDVVGVWWASSDGWTTKAAALDVAILAALFVVAGIASLPRRPRDGTGLIAAGALGIGILFGAVSLRYLTSSQLPTDLPPDVARATVAVCAGLGVGLALVPLLWWLHEPARPRVRSRPPAI
jgi:hypothetical protein